MFYCRHIGPFDEDLNEAADLLFDPVCHSLSDAILAWRTGPLGNTESELARQVGIYQRRHQWLEAYKQGSLLVQYAPAHKKALETFAPFLIEYATFLNNSGQHRHSDSILQEASTYCNRYTRLFGDFEGPTAICPSWVTTKAIELDKRMLSQIDESMKVLRAVEPYTHEVVLESLLQTQRINATQHSASIEGFYYSPPSMRQLVEYGYPHSKSRFEVAAAIMGIWKALHWSEHHLEMVPSRELILKLHSGVLSYRPYQVNGRVSFVFLFLVLSVGRAILPEHPAQ